jgi:hypothetical protein
LGVIVGVATTNATLALTLSVKAVVLVTPPPVDVTVIGKFPVGVDPLVVIFNTVEQVGLQDAEEKEPAAPEGRPETLKETAWLLPEVKVGVIVFEPEEPAFTEIAPEFESEKSKGWVTVREALAMELGAYPLLKPLAFTTALLVKLSVPAYGFEDWVGVEPSVV